jgi:transcriptional regulator
MYVPQSFAMPDAAAWRELIEANGFATLVSTGPDGLVATHLPVMLDATRGPNGTLVAHLARTNPHGASLDGADVLAIFTGPHGYISPSWYAAHPAVPTWNYAAVHVYGRARLVNEPARLRAIVAGLVDKYESGRAAPWSMTGLLETFVGGMLKGIVGVEIEIARVEGKHKLSQNRSAVDRRQVIAALAASDDADDRALADYMARYAPPPSAA